jgi:hypothetical protein
LESLTLFNETKDYFDEINVSVMHTIPDTGDISEDAPNPKIVNVPEIKNPSEIKDAHTLFIYERNYGTVNVMGAELTKMKRNMFEHSRKLIFRPIIGFS